MGGHTIVSLPGGGDQGEDLLLHIHLSGGNSNA